MNIQKTSQFIPKSPSLLKVLIVEDNLINADALCVMLEGFGIRNIVTVKTGEEALRYFSERFDIIFTDFRLPKMNGAEIAHHYRTVFPKEDTPIVCCSSNFQNNTQTCINAGITGLLSKPYSMQELLEMLEFCLPSFLFKMP